MNAVTRGQLLVGGMDAGAIITAVWVLQFMEYGLYLTISDNL